MEAFNIFFLAVSLAEKKLCFFFFLLLISHQAHVRNELLTKQVKRLTVFLQKSAC